eukprot:984477-Rhodomonas_salina.1
MALQVTCCTYLNAPKSNTRSLRTDCASNAFRIAQTPPSSPSPYYRRPGTETVSTCSVCLPILTSCYAVSGTEIVRCYQPNGCTNVWDALRLGMETLEKAVRAPTWECCAMMLSERMCNVLCAEVSSRACVVSDLRHAMCGTELAYGG